MRIFRLLAGYTLIMISYKNSKLSAAHPCTEDKQNGTSRALCSNKGLQLVPQDLDENIQYLDLSENQKMKDLNTDSFTRYKKLTWLSLRNCRIETDIGIPYDGFKSLENLEDLDISGLQHKGTGKRDYKLPLNLRILKINKTGIGDLITTDLKKLEYVDASENLDMVEFPLFDKNAKIHTVILSGVKLDHLVVTQIAPNCYIKRLYLSIDSYGGSELLEPNKFCECINIHRWVKQFINESNLLYSKSDLPCRKLDQNKTDAEICPEDNSYKAALAERDKCFQPPGSFPTWLYYVGGAVILILIAATLPLIFLDIKLATHIRRAHAALLGRSSDDNDEETRSEEQSAQEDQPTPTPVPDEE